MSSVLKGHIRVIIHQLRLRVIQIDMEQSKQPDELELKKLLVNDYYYKKLLPLITCDSIKEQYLFLNKKVLQDGVMMDVCDVCLNIQLLFMNSVTTIPYCEKLLSQRV